MIRQSLRLRLLVVAIFATGFAVTIAAFGLVALFDRHVERRIDVELETYLRQLAANVTIGPDGSLALSQSLAEPRFNDPFSGLYWQVQGDNKQLLLRSRSLWDTELLLPATPPADRSIHRYDLSGPQNAKLIAVERAIRYQSAWASATLRLVVAIDRRDLDEARQDFAIDIVPFLLLITAAFLIAVWIQISIGLRPLHHLRQGLQAVRNGVKTRLDNQFPQEVAPLVQEVNDLLDAQAEAIERARSRAADLAHGLKTPLTVLTADAARLRAKGEIEIATEMTELASAMRRQVDQELVRARIEATRRAAHPLQEIAPIVARLIRTLQRTPRGESVSWESDIDEHLALSIDPDDLSEMLGNLLENAMKWTRSSVRVQAEASVGTISITVEDDGPGVPADKIAQLGQRGVRLDRGVQGSGRGLAIVSDIAAAYGGELDIAAAAVASQPAGTHPPLGGLRARLRFPRRQSFVP